MTTVRINADQIHALAAFDTPTIANAMDSLHIGAQPCMGPQLRAMAGASAVVGVAVTATMQEQWGGAFAHLEPWLGFLEEFERAGLPAVAVFQDTSETPGREAMIGEGMARVMQRAGARGVICAGSIRDIAALRQLALPVWASGLVASRGRIRFHRYQVPVQVDGMEVHPGDVIHADENGAIIVPADRAADIAAAAARITEKEAALFRMFGEPDFCVARLRDYYAEMTRSTVPQPGPSPASQ
jgi:regulator of RNase E activity RraA